MSVRTLIFCDRCNEQRIHNNSHSNNNGTLDNAIKLGWQLSEQGDILCPDCAGKGGAMLLIDDRWDSSEIKLNIKTHKQAQNNS